MRSAVVFLTGLALACRADVTWSRCRRPGEWRRVLDSPLDNATTLNLEFCGIQRLKLNDFNDTVLPKLMKISLDYNQIEYINPAVFTPVPYVRELSIHSNNLTKVPVFGLASLFPRLRSLSLSKNKINGIIDERTFSACVKLSYLYLQRNQIKILHPDVFKPLVKLRHIDLENNKLTFISDTMFQIKPLKNIFLARNSIQYVSTNAFLGSKLRDLRLHTNKLSYLPVNMTCELKAAGARLFRFLFHENPWQCECLAELLADVKRTRVDVYWDGEYNDMNRWPVCQFPGSVCQRPLIEYSTKVPTDDSLST